MKKIALTRSSVSMADDACDNSLEIEVDDNWKLSEILNKVLSMGYLPTIFGGRATWSVAGDRAVAIIAQQWSKPRFMLGSEYENCDKLHFSYHAQEDPEFVYKVISQFRTAT